MSDEDNEFGFDVGRTVDGAYFVALGHQCDDWVIVGDPDEDYSTTREARDGRGRTHVRDKAEAVERMERFIAEARATLERLKALP